VPKRLAIIVSIALALIALTMGQSFRASVFAQSSEKAETKATMRGLYKSLVDAFIFSQNTAAFADPEKREDVLLALRTLSAQANRLEEHSSDLDPSFDYLRRSLARDASAAAQRFEDGEYAKSRFVISKLVENCVACHTRLPSDQDFNLGEEFVQSAGVQSQSAEDMIRLQVATRQFEPALRTYEMIFSSTSILPETIEMIGSFENYLKLCIRVERDPGRAKRTLEEFAARSDVSQPIRDEVTTWAEALAGFERDGFGGDPMNRASELIEDGQVLNRFPGDRAGLVQFVVASSLLHSYLDTKPADKSDMAEAFYLLGVSDSYIAVSHWVSETEYFLAQAIRLDPRGPHAINAYNFLEQYIAAGYTGSSGTNIPPDVQEGLDELRRLIR